MNSQNNVITESVVPEVSESFKDSVSQFVAAFGGTSYHEYRRVRTDSPGQSDDADTLAEEFARGLASSDSPTRDVLDKSSKDVALTVLDPHVSCGSQQVVVDNMLVAQSTLDADALARKSTGSPPVVSVESSPTTLSPAKEVPNYLKALMNFEKCSDIRKEMHAKAVSDGAKQAGSVTPPKTPAKAVERNTGSIPAHMFNWAKDHAGTKLKNLKQCKKGDAAAREVICAQIADLYAKEAGIADAKAQIRAEEVEAGASIKEDLKERVVMDHTFDPEDVIPVAMLETNKAYREMKRHFDTSFQQKAAVFNVGSPNVDPRFRVPLEFTAVPYLWWFWLALAFVSLIAYKVSSGWNATWWLCYLTCCLCTLVGQVAVSWPDDRDRAITDRGDYYPLLRQRNAFGLLLMSIASLFPLITAVFDFAAIVVIAEFSLWSAIKWTFTHVVPILFGAALACSIWAGIRNCLLSYCVTEFEVSHVMRAGHTIDYKQVESGPPTKVVVSHVWKIRDDRSEDAKMQDLAIPQCHLGTYLMRCVLLDDTGVDAPQGWLLRAMKYVLSLLVNTVEQTHSFHYEMLLQLMNARTASAILDLKTRMAKIDMVAQTFNKVNFPISLRISAQQIQSGTNSLAAYIIESGLYLLRQTHAGGYTPRATSEAVAK